MLVLNDNDNNNNSYSNTLWQTAVHQIARKTLRAVEFTHFDDDVIDQTMNKCNKSDCEWKFFSTKANGKFFAAAPWRRLLQLHDKNNFNGSGTAAVRQIVGRIMCDRAGDDDLIQAMRQASKCNAFELFGRHIYFFGIGAITAGDRETAKRIWVNGSGMLKKDARRVQDRIGVRQTSAQCLASTPKNNPNRV